jgi:hypothetical protein
MSKWGEAVIVHILEAGKDHSFSVSYCPLCLTSCACKCLRELVNYCQISVAAAMSLEVQSRQTF